MENGKNANKAKAYLVTGLCVLLVVAFTWTIGYAWYSHSIAANGSPVLFKDEVEKIVKGDIPISFIGMVAGDLAQYPELYKSLPVGTVGITYTIAGNPRLESSYDITYWIIGEEKGGMVAKKLSSAKYTSTEFYRVKTLTAKGMSLEKIDFMNTEVPFTATLLGLIFGFGINVVIENHRRKSKFRAQ